MRHRIARVFTTSIASLLLIAALFFGTQTPAIASASFPIVESFAGSSAPGWVLGGNAYLNEGWLTLTPNSGSQAGYAYYSQDFSSTLGLVVDFDYASWGGSVPPADGTSFFLFDGTTTNFSLGPPGGYLGYTATDTVPGLSNAYVGIGLDEYGNFSPQRGGPGFIPNSIVVRGPGNGTTGYEYLTGASNESFTGNRNAGRRIQMTISKDKKITVRVRPGVGQPYQTVIDSYQLPSAPPATLKLGFSASTGGLSNYHEIRNLTISVPVDLSTTMTSSVGTATLSPGRQVAYTVNTSNIGLNDANGSTINLTATGLTNLSWTCSAAAGGSCASPSGTGTSAGVNLPVNSNATLIVNATVAANAGASVSLTAAATAPSGYTNTSTSSSVTLTNGITHDTTPPVTTISAPTTWQNEDVPVTFAATDNLFGVDATYYTVDGGAQQTGTSLTLSTEGVHTLTYWSVDKAGNAETAHAATVKLDKTPPTISGATERAANANGWYNADVTVAFTCGDALSGMETCSAPTTLSAEAANQSVTGNAADTASNIASATVPGINIDKTAPVSTISAPTTWQNKDVPVTFTATDNLSDVDATYYTVDSGAQQTGTNVTLSTEGVHTLTYWSVDKAGNAEAAHTATVKIDKTPPTIKGATDRAANANSWYNADVTVAFTCVDPLSANVASGVASCSAPTTLSAEAANQSVTGNADDIAGNTAGATVSGINIDKTAPVTTVTPDRAANANTWYKANMTVTLAASDNLSGVAKTEYNLDGAGWTAYTTPVAISGEGMHSLLYRSTDTADNVEATNSLTLQIDKTPPEAYLQFDPVSHDIQLFGRDALSGLADPGPIVPVSVTPIRGDDHGQQGGKKGDHKGDDRDDDRSTAETRTYLVKDLADNTLQLVVQVQKEGHDIKARVVSLQYNGGTVIGPLRDVLSWNWAVAKDGSLKMLEQQMGLLDGRTGSAVEAHYDARKNVTWIVRRQPGGRSDDNKNRKGQDDGEYPGAVKLPGVVLLRLASSQGLLVIEIPGLGH